MITKPAPPRSPYWDRVKRPNVVTKLVLFASLAYGACFAGATAMLYGLLRWLVFPEWPLYGMGVFAFIAGFFGFSFAFRSAMKVIHMSLRLPDDDRS